MTKGFQNSDETKIAIVVRRLTPSAKRNDIHAFADGVREAQTRYGHSIADEGMRQCFEQFPELASQAIAFLPDSMKPHLMDAAYEIMAQSIEDAGLRLEDHFRVSDQGAALSCEAVRAIADTGFPRIAEFGAGNESLDGVGIDRNPFMHHLSEFMEGNREYINSWAAISLIVTIAQGWDEGNRETAQHSLEAMVFSVAPTLDLPTLQRRARYDDRSLLQLASYAERGFNAIAQKAVDNRK